MRVGCRVGGMRVGAAEGHSPGDFGVGFADAGGGVRSRTRLSRVGCRVGGMRVGTAEGHTMGDFGVVSADGRRVVSGSWDNTVRVGCRVQGMRVGAAGGHTGTCGPCWFRWMTGVWCPGRMPRGCTSMPCRGNVLGPLEGHTSG